LTREAQLSEVRRRGRSVRTRYLTIHALANDAGVWRVGLVVPRLGHTAVARNTLKRRLREIARLELLSLPGGYDVVIRASGPAYSLDYWGLREAVLSALERLSLR